MRHDPLRVTPTAAKARGLCPNCKQRIDISAGHCPFCSVPVDPGAAEAAADLADRVGEACVEAPRAGPVKAFCWWVRFGAIRSDDSGFARAKRTAIRVMCVWAVVLLAGIGDLAGYLLRSHKLQVIYAFHEAVRDGDISVVQALFRAHPDLEFSKDQLRLTPLEGAAWSGQREIAEFLVAHGAAVNGKTLSRALWQAAAGGHKALAEFLVVHGADVNARDDDGMTPLHYAADMGGDDVDGNCEVANFLISKGVDINAKDDRGRTPLHHAIRSHRLAGLLVACGADANARDAQGNRPQDNAGSMISPDGWYHPGDVDPIVLSTLRSGHGDDFGPCACAADASRRR